MRAFGVGHQLHVERRPEATVGHLHHPSLGVGRAHPRLALARVLAAIVTLAARAPTPIALVHGLHLRQLRKRATHRLLALPRRPLPRRPLPRRRRAGVRVELLPQRRNLRLRLLMTALERAAASERRRARVRTHPRAVLRQTLQTQHLRVHQAGQHLREQLVELRAVLHTKVAQRVVIRRQTPADPSVGVVPLAQPRHMPRRVHSLARRVQPQPEQHLRVQRWSPRVAAPRPDRRLKLA